MVAEFEMCTPLVVERTFPLALAPSPEIEGLSFPSWSQKDPAGAASPNWRPKKQSLLCVFSSSPLLSTLSRFLPMHRAAPNSKLSVC